MIGGETPLTLSKKQEPLESTIVSKIKKAISKKWPNAFYFKVHGGMYQSAGIPDLVGCIDGMFFAIEVKRPSTKTNVTPLQQACIEQIIKAGGIAFVSWSETDAVQMLDLKLQGRKVTQGNFY
jgi:hypothetical protein